MVNLEENPAAFITLRFLPPYAEGDERAYLDALRRISGRAEPFTLMTVFAGGGALSRESEREQALWYKQTRAAMNELCRGLAIVRPNASEAMAETFRKLWSFPIAAFVDETAARDFLLPKRPAP